MPLILNEDQQLLKESAQAFLSENVSINQLRQLRDTPSEPGYDVQIWQQMVELGWAAIIIPEQYGGLGFGHVGLGQIVEKMGANLCVSPFFSTAVLGASVILHSANEQFKEALLPEVASGQLTLALALDDKVYHCPENISLQAKKQADGYVLNGQKRLVVDAPCADKLIVAANSDDGLVLFIVDRTSQGLSVERTTMVDVGNAGIVSFDNLLLTQDAVLALGDQAATALRNALAIGNIHLSAELLGIADESFTRTNEYLKERKQFGVPIGMFQALQHRAAHLWSEIELCKSVVLKALQELDAQPEGIVGDDVISLASVAKAKLSQVTELATNEAIQLHGGIGMTDEFDIGFFIKRARVAQAFLGGEDYHLDKFAQLNGY